MRKTVETEQAAPHSPLPGIARETYAEIGRAARLDRIILFGSAARGEASRRSDLDFICIGETEERFLDRIGRVLRIFHRRIPKTAIDLLVYTPEEFDRMVETGNKFLAGVLREGVVVYEQG